MADTTNPPSATMGDFEYPPSAEEAAQNNKAVTFSATPDEIDKETIEKLKKLISYEIDSSMSVKVVLKETYARFKVTDPKVVFVSNQNPSIIIRTSEDFEKIPTNDFPKFFSAEIKNGKTWLSLFLVSESTIGYLKRHSFGFYEYASKKVWIQECSSFTSTNVRRVGFFVRKDPRKVNRDVFAIQISENLASQTLDAESSALYQEANEALPFEGSVPPLKLKLASNIAHGKGMGIIQTQAIMVFCDQLHVKFLAKLLMNRYEDGAQKEQFAPHSLLFGDDPENHRSYRAAIRMQNQYLAEAIALPVIGVSPKALKEVIDLENGQPPATLLEILDRYPQFTSIEATPQSATIGKYFFMTTSEKKEQGKTFITDTLPNLWAKLSNTFLTNFPSSVNCPRLTTSNLKDAATVRTAKLLATLASDIPDDLTANSKWSKPPQFRQQPPRAVTVNYTEANFPSMTKNNQTKRATQNTHQATTAPAPQIESTSVHSHASATSAGTNFTKDDGISLFTTLTESFMEDMKSRDAKLSAQNDQIVAAQTKMLEKMQIQQNQQADQQAQITEANLRSDRRFESLLQSPTHLKKIEIEIETNHGKTQDTNQLIHGYGYGTRQRRRYRQYPTTHGN
jgi:hypothetical protein